MKPVRFGMIGVGAMVRICHIHHFLKLREEGVLDIFAMCDVDEGNLKERSEEAGVETVYTDHHEMFEKEELDAVLIAVPPFAHTDAEIIAAEKGIGVLVEKPPALDMAKAGEICRALEKAGVVNAVAFNERYCETTDFLRERLDGVPIRGALVHRLRGGKSLAWWWMKEEKSGGFFTENVIHKVDLLRYLGAEPETVSAFYVARPNPTEELDVPLVQCVNYRTADGGALNLTAATALEKGMFESVLIICDGMLIEHDRFTVRINGEEVFGVPEENRTGGGKNQECYYREFKAFADAVRAGDQSLVRSSYRDGMKSLACTLGAAESARRGGELLDLPGYMKEHGAE